MDALTLNIHKLLDCGFASTSNVSFQSQSSNPWKEVGRTLHPSKRFYVTTVESSEGLPEGHEPLRFEQAFTLDDKYIGGVDDAEYICCKNKITPEIAQPSHGVCSVGQDDDGKWFGWSHRAMSSFDDRNEAVEFAESVSSSTIEEAKDHVENNIEGDNELLSIARKLFADVFESNSARSVNVAQCVWFRYNGTRRVGLKTKDGDKFMVDKGDIYGVRYNQRQDRLEVYSNEALDLPFDANIKTVEKLVGNSKAYRGKVDGKVIPKQKDWLVPAQRKAFDRKHSTATPKSSTATRKPRTPKPSSKVEAIAPPKSPDVKVVSGQDLLVKAKKAKMKDYQWFKVVGKVPLLKCMDKGDRIEAELEKGDVIGIRYVPDTNEIVMVMEEDSTLQFPTTLNNLRKFLKNVNSWSGQVNGLQGRASRATANAAATYWISRDFTKEFNSGKRQQQAAVQVKAENEFIGSVDVDEGGLATNKKAHKDLEKVINSGEKVWFAAGVTNTARDKANVVFDTDKKKCIARLMPMMKGNAGDHITTGIVSKAHGIYREYVETGERKAGISMHSGRIQPLIRDAEQDSVSSTKSGNIVSQEVTVPEFNENIEQERIEKAPVFKGNDVEVLLQISNLITSRKAFTSAFQPLPKLKQIRAGECLLLRAKYNNERYRVEGTQVINRLRRFYGTKSISGAFKENNGDLFLVVYLAKTRVKSHDGEMVEQDENIRERSLRIRQFMTNQTPEKQASVQNDAKRVQVLTRLIRESEARVSELEAAKGTLVSALNKRRSKLKRDQDLGSNVEQHEAKIAEYESSLAALNAGINTKRKSMESSAIEMEQLVGAKKDQRSVVDSVYAMEDGEQVVIVKANYPAGELIVSPIKGSKANYDRQIAVDKLYDLGGNRIL